MVVRNVAREVAEREVLGRHAWSGGVTLSALSRLELAGTLQGHAGSVGALAFNEDGSMLASGSDDLRIKLFDVAQRKLVASLDSKHAGDVASVAFLSEQRLVSGSADFKVHAFDVTRHVLRRWQCCRGRVRVVLGHPAAGPAVFLCGGDEGAVRQFDLREKHACEGEGESCRNVLVDFRNRSRHTPGARNKLAVYSVARHPSDPHRIALGASDAVVRAFDTRALSLAAAHCAPDAAVAYYVPEKLRSFALPSGQLCVSGVAYNWSGSQLLATYRGDNVYLFDSVASRRAAHPSPVPAAACPAPPDDPGPSTRPLLTDAPAPAAGSGPAAAGAEGGDDAGARARAQAEAAGPHPGAAAGAGGGQPPAAAAREPAAAEGGGMRGEEEAAGLGAAGPAGHEGEFGGHRNRLTAHKEAAFVGPRSEAVVAACDSGRVFVWERGTGRVVALLERADEECVFRVRAHPRDLLLASCGMEHVVKLWAPGSGGGEEGAERAGPDPQALASAAIANQREREALGLPLLLPAAWSPSRRPPAPCEAGSG